MRRKTQFEMHLLRSLWAAQFDVADNGLLLSPNQIKANSSPSRGRVLNFDLFAGRNPIPWRAFSQIQNVFIGILQHEHPPNQQRNRLLRRNTVEPRIPGNSSHLASRPTSAGVSVITMGIQKKQKLFYAIEPQ